MSQTKFQKFKTEEVHRSRLLNAEYNPRVISDKAKEKLRDNLKRVGLVQPIIWNKKTGNIVGGHQRVAALDALEGTADYTMTVAVVELDEKAEKEQNLFLNNAGAMGDWDLEKLEDLLGTADYTLAGFDGSEIHQLFGDAVAATQSEAMSEFAEQIRMARDRYTALESKSLARDSEAFYAVLVFKNNEQREQFCSMLGEEDNRYINGETVKGHLAKLGLVARVASAEEEEEEEDAGEDADSGQSAP
jgi:hypothetical protein